MSRAESKRSSWKGGIPRGPARLSEPQNGRNLFLFLLIHALPRKGEHLPTPPVSVDPGFCWYVSWGGGLGPSRGSLLHYWASLVSEAFCFFMWTPSLSSWVSLSDHSFGDQAL